MADEASQNIEDALNKIVKTTDQSGNMRKDLKKTIFETVSTLRSIFHKVMEMLDEKTKRIKHLEYEFTKLNKELDNCRRTTPKGQAETPMRCSAKLTHKKFSKIFNCTVIYNTKVIFLT
jgi:uncharacterized coiled-coil DUF342 family protein